jgi:hypothetical protein
LGLRMCRGCVGGLSGRDAFRFQIFDAWLQMETRNSHQAGFQIKK